VKLEYTVSMANGKAYRQLITGKGDLIGALECSIGLIEPKSIGDSYQSHYADGSALAASGLIFNGQAAPKAAAPLPASAAAAATADNPKASAAIANGKMADMYAASEERNDPDRCPVSFMLLLEHVAVRRSPHRSQVGWPQRGCPTKNLRQSRLLQQG
jgi:hypothetical protein